MKPFLWLLAITVVGLAVLAWPAPRAIEERLKSRLLGDFNSSWRTRA